MKALRYWLVSVGVCCWCVSCATVRQSPEIHISSQQIVIPATPQTLQPGILRELGEIYRMYAAVQIQQQERQFIAGILIILAFVGVSLGGIYLWLFFSHPRYRKDE